MNDRKTDTGLREHGQSWKPIALVGINFVGVLIGYASTILIARSLSVDAFQEYIGSIATLTFLATISEAGFGKYALKVIPQYQVEQQDGKVRDYVSFALLGCLALSISIGLVAIAAEIWFRSGRSETVVIAALLLIPFVSLAGVSVDLVLALQRPIWGTFLSRCVIPFSSLLAIVLVVVYGRMSVMPAIACFGVGGIVASVLASATCLRIRPSGHGETVRGEIPSWFSKGLSFFAMGWLMAWFFKATFVLLHHLPHTNNDLALLAPAFESGCLVLLFSKSTDKYYQPLIAGILASADWQTGIRLRNQRYKVIGVGVVTFMVAMIVFGQQILGWYGNAYDDSYHSLLIVSGGACVWSLFSLAPTFLMFAGRQKRVFINTGLHAALITVLTVLLFMEQGKIGAATAFSGSITSLAFSNFLLARMEVRARRSKAYSTQEPLG
ncbi:MAG: hypothetical protein AAGD07_04320 [Planctomycetota bacterium]